MWSCPKSHLLIRIQPLRPSSSFISNNTPLASLVAHCLYGNIIIIMLYFSPLAESRVTLQTANSAEWAISSSAVGFLETKCALQIGLLTSAKFSNKKTKGFAFTINHFHDSLFFNFFSIKLFCPHVVFSLCL